VVSSYERFARWRVLTSAKLWYAAAFTKVGLEWVVLGGRSWPLNSLKGNRKKLNFFGLEVIVVYLESAIGLQTEGSSTDDLA